MLSCIIGSGGGGASLYRRSVVKVDRRGGGGVRHKYMAVAGHKNLGEFDIIRIRTSRGLISLVHIYPTRYY